MRNKGFIKFLEHCKKYSSLFPTKENRKPIDDFDRKAYHAYFQVKFGDQDKSLALLIVGHPRST